jgi:hypothetical protein
MKFLGYYFEKPAFAFLGSSRKKTDRHRKKRKNKNE